MKQPFQDETLKKLKEMMNLPMELDQLSVRSHKSQFEQVREFHKAFECPAPEVPTELSDKLSMNRASFILEEVIELLYATAGNKERFNRFFAELILNAEKTYDKQLTKPFPEDKLIGQIDAFTDILYFANGGFVESGVIPDDIFSIVHQANMGKIFPDGKPHYNEVGKVVKPDNWEEEHAPEPKILAEVERQIKLGGKRFE
ncbi:HAD family hydrolase [Paenibacillus sp. FSL H3-0333]|uniref:HAD family hydrolase n=1 Tax=Paenibacillus sp. FSL H3-0333 TaxID=2921373 RepID=UPI0030FA9FAF